MFLENKIKFTLAGVRRSQEAALMEPLVSYAATGRRCWGHKHDPLGSSSLYHHFYPFRSSLFIFFSLEISTCPVSLLFCVSLPLFSLRLPPGLPSLGLGASLTSSGGPGVCCQRLSKLLHFLSCCCPNCYFMLYSHYYIIYMCIMDIRSDVFVFVFSLS